jgi:primary-amine oxidase
LLIADPASWHARRAEFADHAIWLTKYKDGQFYSGSKFTNQSRGGNGIKSYVAKTMHENARDEDIVVWHSFSLTHLPRIEDFPVMPAEVISVSLKPSNFFVANPALDVPISEQWFNKSTEYEAESHLQGTHTRKVGDCGCKL